MTPLDQSKALPPCRWPSKPNLVGGDEFNMRCYGQLFRLRRSASCMLVRIKIAERGLSLPALAAVTDIKKHILTQIVRGSRSISGDEGCRLEAVLGIEPGRLAALDQAAFSAAVRRFHAALERRKRELS